MPAKLDQARIAEMVEQMPAFPRSVQQVLNLTSDINAPPKELIRVIEHDPVLTGRILKVVNSAYFGLSRRILSIKHAVVIAGLNTVKHVALSVAALGALPEVDNDGLDMDEYLEHSLATGAVARFIARKVGVPARECEDFFLAGLIHDIGQVVFAIAIPGQFASIVDTSFKRNIPLCQVEARLLGTHHAHIGALVAQKWELPEALYRSIALHHHTGAKAIHDRASAILLAANHVVTGIETEQRPEALAPNVETALGTTTDALLGFRDPMEEAIEKSQVFLRL